MGQTVTKDADAAKFPFIPVGEVYSSKVGKDGFKWTLMDGERVNNPKDRVSIFRLEPHTSPLANNMLKRFKTLRHPYILQLLHYKIVEKESCIYMVTEWVKILKDEINSLGAYPDLFVWGIFQVLNAILFLNTNGLIHGNINFSTIYVTRQGDWKLGGHELITCFEDFNSSDSLPKYYLSHVHNALWSSEAKSSSEGSHLLSKIDLHSLDSWLVGYLIFSLYNPSRLRPSIESLESAANVPPNLKQVYFELAKGHSAEKVLDDPLFENKLVKTCLFVENLAIKNTLEKEKFFSQLDGELEKIPPQIAKYKILPAFLTALNFGVLDHHALPLVIRICKTHELNHILGPSIVKWFSSTDKNMRIALLKNMDFFVDCLASTTQIWPYFVSGTKEEAPELRKLTASRLSLITPKLDIHILQNELLRLLATLQKDPIPEIRVLFPGLSRSLKDSYPPSRRACIESLMSAFRNMHFSYPEVAQKVLPTVSPLAIDTDQQVRKMTLEFVEMLAGYLVNNQHVYQDQQSEKAASKTTLVEAMISKLVGSEEKPVSPEKKLLNGKKIGTIEDLSTRGGFDNGHRSSEVFSTRGGFDNGHRSSIGENSDFQFGKESALLEDKESYDGPLAIAEGIDGFGTDVREIKKDDWMASYTNGENGSWSSSYGPPQNPDWNGSADGWASDDSWG